MGDYQIFRNLEATENWNDINLSIQPNLTVHQMCCNVGMCQIISLNASVFCNRFYSLFNINFISELRLCVSLCVHISVTETSCIVSTSFDHVNELFTGEKMSTPSLSHRNVQN